MPDERFFIDTNIFVYSLYEDSEYHAPSRNLLDRAKDETSGFCITPQILLEYYSIVTNSHRVTKPRTAEEAISDIHTILSFPGISILPQPFDLFPHISKLLERRVGIGGNYLRFTNYRGYVI